MNLASLSPATRERLNAWRWDRIIEKHEGPAKWESTLRYAQPDFMTIDDHDVLLPIGREQHPNVTVVRAIVSDDEQVLTLFLKDTTYVTSQEYEMFEAGYLAVCDRFPGEAFYVAVVYHEWFIIENR